MSDHNKPHGTKRRGSSKKGKVRRPKLERKAQSDAFSTRGENSQLVILTDSASAEPELTLAVAIQEKEMDTQKIAEETDTEENVSGVAEKVDETPDIPPETEEKLVPMEMASIGEGKAAADETCTPPDPQAPEKDDAAEEISTTIYDPNFIDDSSASPSILQIDEKNEDSEEMAETVGDDVCTDALAPPASESNNSDHVTDAKRDKTCALPSMPELAEKNEAADEDDYDTDYIYANICDIPLPPMDAENQPDAGEMDPTTGSDSPTVEIDDSPTESKDAYKIAATGEMPSPSDSDSAAVESDVTPPESKDADKSDFPGEMTSTSDSDSSAVETDVTPMVSKDALKPAGLGEMASVSDSAGVDTVFTLSEAKVCGYLEFLLQDSFHVALYILFHIFYNQTKHSI